MYEKLRNYVRENYVLATLVFAGGAWVVIQLRFLIALFFIAFLIVVGFLPIVRYLEKYRVPHIAAALLPYATTFALIALVLAPFFSQIASQFQEFVDKLASYADSLPKILGVVGLNAENIRSSISSQFQSLATNVVLLFGGAASLIIAITTTITVCIYAQLDYDRIKMTAIEWLKPWAPEASLTYSQLEIDLSAWIIGQVKLCVTIGVFSFLALTLLGVPFAIPLALLAGMLEVLPTVGPILAAIPAILIGLEQSFALGMLVTVAYLGIQFLENSIIVPRVMSGAVNMHTLVIIPALIIGYQFLGIIGAILAIPLFVTARILVRNVPRKNSP